MPFNLCLGLGVHRGGVIPAGDFLLIASSDELDPAERELLSGDQQTTGDDETIIIGA